MRESSRGSRTGRRSVVKDGEELSVRRNKGPPREGWQDPPHGGHFVRRQDDDRPRHGRTEGRDPPGRTDS